MALFFGRLLNLSAGCNSPVKHMFCGNGADLLKGESFDFGFLLLVTKMKSCCNIDLARAIRLFSFYNYSRSYRSLLINNKNTCYIKN